MATGEMGSRWLPSPLDTTLCGFETIFKFVTETEVTTEPKFNSASTGSNFCVIATDSLLATTWHNNVHYTDFKNIIDAIAISEGGLLAVAQREELSIGIVTDEGIIIYKSHAFLKKESQDIFIKLAVQIVNSSGDTQVARLVGLSSKGVLLVINNIVLGSELEMDISKVTVEYLNPPHMETLDFTSTHDQIITVGSGSNCLAVFAIEDGKFYLNDSASLEEGTDLVRVFTTSACTGNTYLTLDNKGIFSVWDGMTLCITYSVQLPQVSDLRLVETKIHKNFSLENVRLIVTTGETVEVMILDPITVISQIKTFGCTKLTYLPVTLDDIYVTEWTHDDDEVIGDATVTLCCYSETPPEIRLQRLILKKRYQEAEEFAKLHGLNFNLNHVIVKQKLNDTKDSFDSMSQHIADCKIQLLKSKSEDSEWKHVMVELKHLEEQLEKFQVIFGKASYSPQSWKVFLMETPQNMFSSLVLENAERAFQLWKCFQEELLKEIKPGVIIGILQRIQPSVPCMVTANWLCELVPTIVVQDPNSMPSLISWIEDLVFYQEENQIEWPDLAIKFCSTLHQSLDMATSCSLEDFIQISPQDFQNRKLCAEAITPLKSLLQNLVELKTLQTKYSFHIQLGVLKKESKESIAYRMLDNVVAIDFMAEALMNQVLPYLQQNRLQTDYVLVKYVQELFKNSTMGELHYSFEEKVQFIIQSITSPRKKIDAVMKLLDNLSLPIPTFVKDLVLLVIHKSQDPMVKFLQEKWKLKERDSIIVSYGERPAAINTPHHVMKICELILASGGPIGDAIKLLDSGTLLDKGLPELHYFQCCLYITRNKVENIHKYLKDLPVKTSHYCCAMIIKTALEMMTTDEDPLAEKMKSTRLQFYNAADIAGPILVSITEDLHDIKEIEQQRQMIKNARNLEVHFNLLYSRETLESRLNCSEAFQKAASLVKMSDMLRLAQFLDVSDGDVVKTAIRLKANKVRSPSERKFLLHLAELIPQKMSMNQAVQNVLTLLDKEEMNHPTLCLTLSQLFSSCCPSDQQNQVMKVRTMCKLAYLMELAWKQCQEVKVKQLKHYVDVYQDEPCPSENLEQFLSSLIDVTLMAASQASGEEVWKEASSLLETLWTHKQFLLAHNTLIHVMELLDYRTPCHEADDEDFAGATIEMKKKLKVISSRVLEQILKACPDDGKPAVAHLLSLPKIEAVELLWSLAQSAGSNNKKLKCISMVALQLAEILEDDSLIEKSQKVQITAKWRTRLQKIGIKLSDRPVCSIGDSISAVEKLAKTPHCTLELLQEYFSDMDIDDLHHGSYMVELFKTCLSEPLFTLAVQRRAEEILNQLKGREKLPVLKQSLYKTHSYNYEVLEFLLSAICELEEIDETVKGLELLKFLKMYTRSSPPGQEEQIHQVGSDGEVILPTDLSLPKPLPEISSRRLPFHMLKSGKYLWNVIAPELNTKTLDSLLGMAHVLQISPAKLIKTTATGLVNAYLATSPTHEMSTEISQDFVPLLKNLIDVLSRISEMKLAVIFGHNLLEKLKSVGEKKLALQEFAYFVKRWHDSADNPHEKVEAKRAIYNYDQMFRRCTVHWALVQAGVVVDGEVSSLLEQPEELIQYLYNLPSVAAPAESNTDVNAVCDSIAYLYEVNLQQLRECLIDKWLLGVSALDTDQTMTFGNVCCVEDEGGNLSRVLYVLRSTGRTKCLRYLSSFLSMTEDRLSPQNRTQVLYCINRSCTQDEIPHYVPG